LQSGDWCEDLLDAACFGTSHPCASELRQKLGRLIPSHSVLGTVSSYFQKRFVTIHDRCQLENRFPNIALFGAYFHFIRFGFSAACVVVAGSGDNPCAMAGLGLSSAGDLGVSLGTSDTV
jgi:sugar (pentulose or hexulose) kinase